MSSTEDIKALAAAKRWEVVEEAYGYRPDRLQLAAAGLEQLHIKERAKAAKATIGPASREHVVRRLRAEVGPGGKVTETWDYLTKEHMPDSMERYWGSPERMKKFGTKKEAEAARGWKGAGEVVAYSEIPVAHRGVIVQTLSTLFRGV